MEARVGEATVECPLVGGGDMGVVGSVGAALLLPSFSLSFCSRRFRERALPTFLKKDIEVCGEGWR